MSLRKKWADVKDYFFGEYFVDEEQSDILQASFYWLRLISMLPRNGRQFDAIDVISFVIIFCPWNTVFCIAEMINMYSSNKIYAFNDLLTGFSLMGAGVNMYTVVICFMRKYKAITALAASIGNFGVFRKPRQFDVANRRANFIAHFFAIYTILAVLGFGFMNYLRRSACLRENEVFGYQRVCGLMAPAFLPDYFNEPPYLYVAVVLQVYSASVASLSASLALTFLCGIIEVLIARVRLLKECMQKNFAIGEVTASEYRQHLNFCVRYHVYIIDLVAELNRALSIVSFVQATFTSGVIALIAFQFLYQPELTTFSHGFGWLLVLGLLSFAGQRLIDETIDIGDSIYFSDWFMGDVECQKCVLMIVWRGNSELFLDTLGFGRLALTTFASAMQNAYSFIAMLHQGQSRSAGDMNG